VPTAVTEMLIQAPPPDPPRKRWTRAECSTLEAAGVFDQQPVELIEGELISKMGKKRPHVHTVTLLAAWLMRTFGDRFVNLEAPIDVAPQDNPTNEPQPDAIVLKRSYSGFLTNTPQPSDLELVVEVSDTSRVFDLTTKASLYARAGIQEYWVLDIQRRQLIVHREPKSGRYSSVIAFGENEAVAPLSAPDKPFPLPDIFAL
jgi:Uma2 family endonuclease